MTINLLGVRLADRPAFFGELFPHLQAMRAKTSRPHWLIIDEAHHLLPGSWDALPSQSPVALGETILVTVHPDHLAPSILSMIDVFVAVGPSPEATLNQFAEAVGRPPVPAVTWKTREDTVACWYTREVDSVFPLEVIHGRAERIRHHRKYSTGELGYRSFFLRGPYGHLNLTAQDLAMFCHIAEGLDDATWQFHLTRGDYSNWLRVVVKDDDLADRAQALEQCRGLSAADSRIRICEAINERYSLPA